VRASRRELLVAGASALAAGPGAAAALAGEPIDLAPGAIKAPPDADQLAGLLGFEHRLEAAYADALERDLIEPALGELLLGHEREHVRALEQVLHARNPAPVGPLDAHSRAEFARGALALEAETVIVYVHVLTTLRNDRLLQPLGSIMACGAQHEVALRHALDQKLL
jgi:Ferritin-like domain